MQGNPRCSHKTAPNDTNLRAHRAAGGIEVGDLRENVRGQLALDMQTVRQGCDDEAIHRGARHLHNKVGLGLNGELRPYSCKRDSDNLV